MEITDKISIGKMGESAAIEFLQKKQYTILALNFRAGKLGEVDIVAKKNDFLCFIEVKTRSSVFFGMPHQAVDYKKQQKIKKTAMAYVSSEKVFFRNIRFDIIEVFLEKSRKCCRIRDVHMIENAF